jgi:hypothetical protein
LADDYAHVYAPYILAAVREVGHNYRQVAKWLTRERIPAQRDGRWAAQSVKNLVVRYRHLTGKRLLIPHNIPRQRTARAGVRVPLAQVLHLPVPRGLLVTWSAGVLWLRKARGVTWF